jgi:Ca2+-transporting ATPase
MGKVVDEFVFDVTRKTITTVWEFEKKKHVFVRGAPEVILEHASMTEKERDHFTSLYEQYAKEGLRVIAFATKIEHYEGKKSREDLEKKLTFLGFVGIYDPPRPGVAKAIATAHQAGIRVMMVTGDNEYTALAIGKEIGLIGMDEDVLTGEDITKLNDQELMRQLDKTTIFARTKPEDKLRLTTLLKKQGFIVGVTGDGVNDALALKKADVGVAMGLSGTDVAKEASDVILADDNFITLLNAVGEGRVIYRNIVKSVTYLVTGNLSELALVLLASAFGLPTPLLPTQILWINLATDGLPALALATDNRDLSVLHNKPRNPKDPILTHKRVLKIFSRGMLLAAGLIGLYTFLLQGHSTDFARTIVFNALILSHLTLAFIIRGQSFFRVNKFLVIATIITIVAQILITTTPVFQHIFHLAL